MNVIACIMAAGMAAAQQPPSSQPSQPPPLRVVSTIGMLDSLVSSVAGERARVTVLMGPGVDPHLYRPTPSDILELAAADLVVHVGLRLEGRMGTVLERLKASGRRVLAAGEAIPREKLISPPGPPGQPDPHVWMDAALWAEIIPALVAAFSELDPPGAAAYERNGAEMRTRLLTLDAWCREQAGRVPAEKRVLVTSHDAFGYFGRAYGFEVIGLQGVSTASEAGLAGLSALVAFLRERRIPAIFVETSVNPAGLRRVAEEAGTAIGGELFSDAMGAPGEMRHGFDTGTYEGMMKANMATIVEGLSGGTSQP